MLVDKLQDQTLISGLESLIAEKMHEQQVPGLAIGIVKDGEVAYTHGFGIASLESQKPVTSQSLFAMGSMSKAFVATAILQLMEGGKLELDALVTDVLPYFRMADERYRDIRIHHLLTHTSGLGSWPPLEDGNLLKYWESTVPELDDGALERYVRSLQGASLTFAPGTGYGYSNAAYNVLAEVVAKVSGQPFEQYAQEHILAPLNMQKSTFLLHDADQELLARPHYMDEAGEVVESRIFPYTRAQIGAGYLLSNVEDMGRWALANMNRGTLDGARILADATYDLLWTPQVDPSLPASEGINYGFGTYSFGWNVSQIANRAVVSHAGAQLGFCSHIVFAPDYPLGIVAMANRMDNLFAAKLAIEIANTAMERLLYAK